MLLGLRSTSAGSLVVALTALCITGRMKTDMQDSLSTYISVYWLVVLTVSTTSKYHMWVTNMDIMCFKILGSTVSIGTSLLQMFMPLFVMFTSFATLRRHTFLQNYLRNCTSANQTQWWCHMSERWAVLTECAAQQYVSTAMLTDSRAAAG